MENLPCQNPKSACLFQILDAAISFVMNKSKSNRDVDFQKSLLCLNEVLPDIFDLPLSNTKIIDIE